MKWVGLLPLAGCLLAGGFVGYRINKSAPTPARRVLYYQDPMHPAYRSEKPGTAPDCGMQLVPVYADDVAASVAPAGRQADQEAVLDPAVQRLYGIQVVPVSTCLNRAQMFEVSNYFSATAVSRRPQRSSGLDVEQTLLVGILCRS